MTAKLVDNHKIDEIFRERIVPYLGMAETEKALHETELIYKALCDETPAKENVGFLYQEFFSTYEFLPGSAAKQAVLDCIEFLNHEVSKNPGLSGSGPATTAPR
jgi:hypothetical protein